MPVSTSEQSLVNQPSRAGRIQNQKHLSQRRQRKGVPITYQKHPNLRTTVITKDGTHIYYKDWGKGQPVVFSHGWPLTSDAWDDQMFFLANRGYRCIAHDRRG